MTTPLIFADFVAQTCTIDGVTTPITDHWQQSPSFADGALNFTADGLVASVPSSPLLVSAPVLITDSGMGVAAGNAMAAGCIVEFRYKIITATGLRTDPYEYILFDYWGDTGGADGGYFDFSLVNLGSSLIYRVHDASTGELLIDNVPASTSDTLATWRFEEGVLTSISIDGGTVYSATPHLNNWGPDNTGGDLFGFNESLDGAVFERAISSITFYPLPSGRRKWTGQVGLIPADVGIR